MIKKISSLTSSRLRLVGLVLLVAVLVCVAFVGIFEDEIYYKSYDRSRISISGTANIGPWSVSANTFSCNGNFLVEKGELQNISALQFVLPITQLSGENAMMGNTMVDVLRNNAVDEISFRQTKSMVLPVMKMAHVVGELSIGNVKNIIELQLAFVQNNDQSLTFKGVKPIKLSDYQIKMTDGILGAVHINDEVMVDLTVTLSNKPVSIVKSEDLAIKK